MKKYNSVFASLATLARSQSHEILIEHPSLGLTSLAQLCKPYANIRKELRLLPAFLVLMWNLLMLAYL